MAGFDERLSGTAGPAERLHDVDCELVVAFERLTVVGLGVGLDLGSLTENANECGGPLVSLLLLGLGEVLADELNKDKVVLVHMLEGAFQLPRDLAVVEFERGERLGEPEHQNQNDLLLANKFLGVHFLEEQLHLENGGVRSLLPPPQTDV